MVSVPPYPLRICPDWNYFHVPAYSRDLNVTLPTRGRRGFLQRISSDCVMGLKFLRHQHAVTAVSAVIHHVSWGPFSSVKELQIPTQRWHKYPIRVPSSRTICYHYQRGRRSLARLLALPEGEVLSPPIEISDHILEAEFATVLQDRANAGYLLKKHEGEEIFCFRCGKRSTNRSN